MPEFVDPPISKKALSFWIENLIYKNYKGLSNTIVAFIGSGHLAPLKYLVDNHNSIPNLNNKHVYFLLDTFSYSLNHTQSLKEALLFLYTRQEDLLTSELLTQIKEVESKPAITFADIIDVSGTLVKNGYSCTFIIDNFGYIFKNNSFGKEFVELLISLKKLNPPKISFDFIVDIEFQEADLSVLGRLNSVFLENFIYGKDIMFDAESAACLFKNQEKWNKAKYQPEYVDLSIKVSYGDPSVVKVLAQKVLSYPEFQKELVELKDMSEMYSVSGLLSLDSRYNKIMATLREQSIAFLTTLSGKPTDFIVMTGLVKGSGSEYTLLNPFFEVFLKKRYKKTPIIEATIGSINLKEYLTSQELLVLEALEQSSSTIVDRDKVAQIMWGSDWEDKYSDWAIDKLISNLRKKLIKTQYPKILKTVKNQGFMLV